MRIARAGIVHETNTYPREQTPINAFQISRGDQMMKLRGTETQSGGAIDTCIELGVTAVPILHAFAQPTGIISAQAYDTMKTDLLERLAHEMPVDGVFLDLHGAGSVDGCLDLEADLAEEVRRPVGESLPITDAFDLHGNVTQRMADVLDGAFVCHEFPHIDMHNRAGDAVRLFCDMLEHWRKMLALISGHSESL